MDIKISLDTLTKSFIYGFLLSGSLLITFTMGNLVKNAFAFLNKLTK